MFTYQTVISVVAGLLFLNQIFVWQRLMKPAKDDPRLSRGLQLLQSKIAVLEDLSERTEQLCRQMMSIIDEKSKVLQNQMHESEQLIGKIQHSMTQSLEVAQIFEEKIPHQEIIQRQTTKKYIEAARLAHSGQTIDQIAKSVDLPRGELELITKINQNELVYAEESLPAWAKSSNSEQQSLQKLGDEFRKVGYATMQEDGKDSTKLLE